MGGERQNDSGRFCLGDVSRAVLQIDIGYSSPLVEKEDQRQTYIENTEPEGYRKISVDSKIIDIYSNKCQLKRL